MNQRLRNFLKTLGPGVLFASTAIGVSHLVQCTRAGANYGFALFGFIILANLFKYPAFEFGSRYANATGESIIAGYKRLGNPILWLYFLVTLITMFFVTAAVGAVTSGFLDNLLGTSKAGGSIWTTAVLFATCFAILWFGAYSGLDRLIKVLGTVLLVGTITAFAIVVMDGPATKESLMTEPALWTPSGIGFLIALMGWMPTAVDLSAWNSLWTLERIKQTGYKPSLRETLGDFNFGYITSAVLALCFLTLGAFLLYGTGKSMPDGGAAFASGVIGLYTEAIGSWGFYLMAPAAFSIMFGTCIAVFDGYARALSHAFTVVSSGGEREESPKAYRIVLMTVALGGFGLIWYFSSRPEGFKGLVDTATTLSFVVAPIIAWANHKLVNGSWVDPEKRPRKWLWWLSATGIVFLAGFTVFYIYTLISA